jgi:hypothetical protein
MRLDTKQNLDNYLEHHIPTGGFLRSVLSNNLFESIKRADEGNLKTIHEIVEYIYNKFPTSCYGSPEKVDKWLQKGI